MNAPGHRLRGIRSLLLVAAPVVCFLLTGCQTRSADRYITGPVLCGDVLCAEIKSPMVRDDDTVELDFILHNTGTIPIRLAERWNSWGAFQWTFKITDAKGQTFRLGNPQTEWWANALTTFEVLPEKTSTMLCRLDLNSRKFRDGSVFVFSWIPAREITMVSVILPNRTISHIEKPPMQAWTFPLTVTGEFEAVIHNDVVLKAVTLDGNPKYHVPEHRILGTNWHGRIETSPLKVEKAVELKSGR